MTLLAEGHPNVENYNLAVTLKAVVARDPAFVSDLLKKVTADSPGRLGLKLPVNGAKRQLILDDRVPTKGSHPAYLQVQGGHTWPLLL